MDGPTLAKLNLLGIEKPHIAREDGLWKVQDRLYCAKSVFLSYAWEGLRKQWHRRWGSGLPPLPPCSKSCRHL